MSPEEKPQFFAHPAALVEEGARVGDRSRIWAFAHVVSGAVIGQDCNVCDHTFVEGGVRIGDRVTIKSGVYLWDGVTVEDDVFIGPAAVFTNDLKPRSRKYLDGYVPTLLKNGCSIGANSTILAGTRIGAWSLVGAGSVVTKDVPDFGVVFGNPAGFRYWICRCAERLSFDVEGRANCVCGAQYVKGDTGEVIYAGK